MRKITLTFLGLSLAFFLLSPAILAQESYQTMPLKTVQIQAGPVFNPTFVTMWVPGDPPLQIWNNTGVTYTIKITQKPGAPVPDSTVAAGASRYYTFTCPQASGEWIFTLAESPATKLTVTVRCEGLPSLTQWGMIILIALIIVTGVYLWLRKRPVRA